MNDGKLKPKVPMLFLEKMALQESSEAEKVFLENNLTSDQRVSSIAGINESNEEILQKFPATQFSRTIQQRLVAPQTVSRLPRKKLFSSTILLAMAACLTLFLFKHGANFVDSQDVLLKGQQAHLVIYRKLGNGYEQVRPNTFAQANDILQVRYIAAGNRFGAVFSIDGRGKITWHYPDSGNQSSELKNSGEIALPFAYQLDDAPQFERFFFVAASEPFSTNELTRELQTLVAQGRIKEASLELPKGMAQFSILIRKSAHD